MRINEAKRRTLGVFGSDGPYRLLSTRTLRALHGNTLRALWRAVCVKTCDVLRGHHSDGCKQLTDEYWRRKKTRPKQ